MSKYKFKDGSIITAATQKLAIEINKIRKNANLKQYQSPFLFRIMSQTNDSEVKEKIKKELESRKLEILESAREQSLNSLWGKIAKELFGIKSAKDIDKIFENERKKVTAFYDFYEMEPKLNKLKGNIKWFLDAVNNILGYLDRTKVIYSVESELTNDRAEYSFTITNNENEIRTFVIMLINGFDNSKVEIKEKLDGLYKPIHKPLMTELKHFLGE